jgi:hypothetical protein
MLDGINVAVRESETLGLRVTVNNPQKIPEIPPSMTYTYVRPPVRAVCQSANRPAKRGCHGGARYG